MSYSKNLGNVKGKTGALVKPQLIHDELDPSKTIIKWELQDSESEEALSDDIIQTVYFIPYVDPDEPYILKWESNVDGVDGIESMELPRGPAGIPGVNIETIPQYTGITNDLDRIRYHYNGTSGIKYLTEELQEGTIFLIIDKEDPNDNTLVTTVAYVYDKERDSYTDEKPNYDDNAFTRIEHPIDLNDYYRKNEVYSKEEIDDMFGRIIETQERIIDILDSGLIEFYIPTEVEEPEIEVTPENPDDNENTDNENNEINNGENIGD